MALHITPSAPPTRGSPPAGLLPEPHSFAGRDTDAIEFVGPLDIVHGADGPSADVGGPTPPHHGSGKAAQASEGLPLGALDREASALPVGVVLDTSGGKDEVGNNNRDAAAGEEPHPSDGLPAAKLAPWLSEAFMTKAAAAATGLPRAALLALALLGSSMFAARWCDGRKKPSTPSNMSMLGERALNDAVMA